MSRIDHSIHTATARVRAVERQSGVGSLPFVGREAEMAALLEAYRRAYNGARVVASVAGEMGSGKTRLLDEFCAHPEVQRGLVVRLRVHHDDCRGNLKVLREALLEVIDARPTLRRHIEGVLEIGPLEHGHDFPLARVLDLLARRVLLVLVVDDFDADREACHDAFADLLRDITQPFLLVASSLPASAGGVTSLCRTIQADRAEIVLPPLGHEGLARGFQLLFDILPGEEDLVWLADVSCGLPILFREAVNALIGGGCIVLRGDQWQQVRPFARCRFTPVDALPLLRTRLAQLPERECRFLAGMALLGHRVPRTIVAELGCPADCHGPLVERDFLRIAGRNVEFAHSLLFEAAFAEAQYRNLFAEMREQLAVWISVAAGSELDLQLPSLTVRYLIESSDAGQRGMILDVLVAAAQAHAARGDLGPALTYFSECHRWMGEITLRRDTVTVTRWIMVYAAVLYKLGRTAEQHQLLTEFLAGIDLAAPPAEIIPEIVHAMLSLVENLSREKRTAESLSLLDTASSTLRGLPSQQSQGLVEEIELRRARTLELADRHAEAIAIYRGIMDRSDPEVFSPNAFEALTWLHGLTTETAEADEVAGLIEQMLYVCERDGRMRQAVQLRSCLVRNLFLSNDFENAEPALRTLIKETRRYSLPRTESNAWYSLGMMSAMQGDFVEALQRLEETIAIRWRVKSIALWQVAVIMKAHFQVLMGRDDDAVATLDELERDATLNNRPYRRFIVEVCRRTIAVRRGAAPHQRKRLKELLPMAEAEGFLHAGQILLELEGEILLHSEKVSVADARDYFQRSLEEDPGCLREKMLFIMAAAIAGRATGPCANGGKRGQTKEQSVDGIVERSLAVLEEWRGERAFHNIAFALRLLRGHAWHLYMPEDIAPFETLPLPGLPDEASHCYEIVSFGRLRVLDMTGAEQGNRHFGTQKSDSKPRKMLAALVVAAVEGRGLARERLVDMVWGENATSDSAANNFHVTLSGLRQVVGDGVDFDGTRYYLNRRTLRIDVLEFLALIDQAHQADRQGKMFQAYDLLHEACQLFGGEFLEGIYDDWSDIPRDMLRAKGRGARLRLAEIALQRGEEDVVRENVRFLLAQDATDEAAMYIHLSMLMTEGDRVRALREYEEFCGLLDNEYGVAPSRQLRELRELIGQQ
jgi:DNA-binding SARP family transcriptional activator/tetratricopeptide (TPR) repeat protein